MTDAEKEISLAQRPAWITEDEFNAMVLEIAQSWVLRSECQRPYVKAAKVAAEQDGGLGRAFKPDDWVLMAIAAAFNAGVIARDVNNEHLVEQMAAQQTEDLRGVTKATIAAVLEVILAEKNELFSNLKSPENSIQVTLHLDAQRTIWDRNEITMALDREKNSVTWALLKKQLH